MKKNLLIFGLSLLLLAGGIRAQEAIPVSVRNVAPNHGIPIHLLADTVALAQYLDSLPQDYPALADTCLLYKLRFAGFLKTIEEGYKHENDTVWVNADHYLADYEIYRVRLLTLANYMQRRGEQYQQMQLQKQEDLRQDAFNRRRDTIERNHRAIENLCSGVGATTKARKKKLSEIYYAYLPIYNGYNLAIGSGDAEYMASLEELSTFQRHLIDNLLNSTNLNTRIENFGTTLKNRCGKTHKDVLRSYQRVFRQEPVPTNFTTIEGYYDYIADLQTIIDVQTSYLEVVDLRDKIQAGNTHIIDLYSNGFRDVAKTYQDIANAVNTLPAFSTLPDAQTFIADMEEFTRVQECYLRDYERLVQIKNRGDTILRRCGSRFGDVAKAYKFANDRNAITPKYSTLDDAERFGQEMFRFETLQIQYDSVVSLRIRADELRDSASKVRGAHKIIFNGLNKIRSQYAFTPSFIDVPEGNQFLHQLEDLIEAEEMCMTAIRLYDESEKLDSQVKKATQSYRNTRKAYDKLRVNYLSIKSIEHRTDVSLYCQQFTTLIRVQNAIIAKCRSVDAKNIDTRLKGVSEKGRIEAILGL